MIRMTCVDWDNDLWDVYVGALRVGHRLPVELAENLTASFAYKQATT